MSTQAHLFTPLASTYLGFDEFFDRLDRALVTASAVSATAFPPLNLYRTLDGYLIELAIAGFKKSDIRIEHDERLNVLTIYGDTDMKIDDLPDVNDVVKSSLTDGFIKPPIGDCIKQGIATRKFSRTFVVSDTIKVKGATLEDGMLRVELIHELVPVRGQPTKISIN